MQAHQRINRRCVGTVLLFGLDQFHKRCVYVLTRRLVEVAADTFCDLFVMWNNLITPYTALFPGIKGLRQVAVGTCLHVDYF